MGFVCAFVLSFPLSGTTQQAEPAAASETINVFADCPRGGCDQDYFRTEMPYVNWMRDRQDADVHILVTPQTTGAGGRLYTLAFIGRGDYQGREAPLSVRRPRTRLKKRSAKRSQTRFRWDSWDT